MDTLSPNERSERMSRVRGKDTGPERAVRQLVYSMGYRYRLHARDLPGRHAFPNELVRNECEGDAGKKKEQRRGKGST